MVYHSAQNRHITYIERTTDEQKDITEQKDDSYYDRFNIHTYVINDTEAVSELMTHSNRNYLFI